MNMQIASYCIVVILGTGGSGSQPAINRLSVFLEFCDYSGGGRDLATRLPVSK